MYFFSKWGEERSCLLAMKVCTSASDAHVNKVHMGKKQTLNIQTGNGLHLRRPPALCRNFFFMRILKKENPTTAADTGFSVCSKDIY